MNKAAKEVGAAIIRMDFRTVVIGGKGYTILPPTIDRLAGAGYYCAGAKEGADIREVLLSMADAKSWAHALSWLIEGNDSLSNTFIKADANEVIDALIEGLSLISIENFLKLSVLMRNVARLTAKPKWQGTPAC